MRSVAFWFAVIVASLFAILAVFMAVSYLFASDIQGVQEVDGVGIVAIVTGLVAALGNLSAILITWRKDRREAMEFKLKIAELERKLAGEAKA